MKNAHLIKYFIFIPIFFLLFLGCSDSSPQLTDTGSGTETVGTLVNKSGDAVDSAFIVLTKFSDNTKYLTSSDSDGKYFFKNLPSGSYTLWAALEDTSLAAIREEILFDSGTTELGTDTMYAPGAVSGFAFAGDSPEKLIEIDILGTSYNATTDSTGKFVMSPIFPGTYNLHFKYNDEEKDVIYEFDTNNIIVTWEDTTFIDTVNLSIISDGVPASPDTLFYSYDTLNETVTLWWPKSKSPDILKYSVNIDDNNSINEISIPTDTSTKINLSSYIDEQDSAKIKIFIHSIDSGNNKSTVASPDVEISVMPSYLVETKLQWEIFPEPLDTSIINKPIQLSINFNNPTRDIDTILWYDMTNDDTLAITYPRTKTGTDTITYSWNKKGQFKIRVEAIDRSGKFWFSPIDTIHVYDSKYFRPENIWITNSEQITSRRKEHSAAILGKNLYIFGGVIETVVGGQKMPSLLNTIENSTISGDTLLPWNINDTLPQYLRYSDAISLNGKLFIIGGLSVDYEISSSIHVFDSATSSWSSYDSLPKPLCAMSVCTLNDMIYITGGIDNNNAHSKKVYKLDPENLSCTEDGELLNAKSYHQVISDGTGIFVLGGLDNIDKKSTSDMEYYNPETGSSTLLGKIPKERMLFGAEIFERKIYIMGGIDDFSTDINGGTALSSVDIYDIDSQKWSKGASLPEDLHSFTTNSYNGLFYIIGGCNTFPSDKESKMIYCYYPFKEERSK